MITNFDKTIFLRKKYIYKSSKSDIYGKDFLEISQEIPIPAIINWLVGDERVVVEGGIVQSGDAQVIFPIDYSSYLDNPKEMLSGGLSFKADSQIVKIPMGLEEIDTEIVRYVPTKNDEKIVLYCRRKK